MASVYLSIFLTPFLAMFVDSMVLEYGILAASDEGLKRYSLFVALCCGYSSLCITILIWLIHLMFREITFTDDKKLKKAFQYVTCFFTGILSTACGVYHTQGGAKSVMFFSYSLFLFGLTVIGNFPPLQVTELVNEKTKDS